MYRALPWPRWSPAVLKRLVHTLEACDNGIIRGGGDTAFSAKMNLISMWLIIVPLSALAAFRWELAPVVVFFLLKWDQLYKIIPVAIRLHSWKWVKVVTRNDSEV